MEILNTKARLIERLRSTPLRVGFVPTMGALHEGHLSLVNKARVENEQVVVSLFVNPTQFNDPNDLLNYPRTPQQDLAMLRAAGTDWVYMPSEEDIYPEPDTRQFDFGPLERVMEGAHRPGHFNGVAQVVSRLFEIVQPTNAYFGEKDFQQLAIIRELVRQMGSSIRVVGCPIIRETDGLALSSRNRLLTPAQRAVAPLIYRALQSMAAGSGNDPLGELKGKALEIIAQTPLLEVEYLSIAQEQNLREATRREQAPLRAFVAVRAANVRLIDNIALG